jgi:hypothetical protein
MSASQLFDEQVKEQHYHSAIGWGPKDHDDSYAFSIGRHLDIIDPRIIVPILSGVFADFNPKAASDCGATKFHVASATLSDLDNGKIRIRSFPEGRKAIDALETAVDKLRKAGFDAPDHPKAFLFNLSDHNVQMAKETNIRDEMIRASLETRNRVTMTEAEYIDFSNFLTTLDPKYPTWSEVGDYGPPTLVKDSGRYFEAYRKFKTQKN